VAHAYDATFHAAVAALLQRGEAGAESDVIPAFRRLAVREQGLDPEIGTLLQSLADRRGVADGSPDALADAATVVAAVEKWIPSAGR
jgi:uncharacterized protein (UPF0332 family)